MTRRIHTAPDGREYMIDDYVRHEDERLDEWTWRRRAYLVSACGRTYSASVIWCMDCVDVEWDSLEPVEVTA